MGHVDHLHKTSKQDSLDNEVHKNNLYLD